MRKQRPIKCHCLFCRTIFYLPLWRVLDLSDGRTQRGVACSPQCWRRIYKAWMMLGSKRDKEFQALMREREKLRRLVRQQRAA